MKIESKQQEIFDSWKAETNIRIDIWKDELVNQDSSLTFDYSQKSLENLENYLISNYDVSSLKDETNNGILDACVSYIGETIISLVSNSKWHMYLDDKTNIYYGLPCVLTKYSGAICIHFIMKELLTKSDGKVLSIRIEKVLKYEELIRSQLS